MANIEEFDALASISIMSNEEENSSNEEEFIEEIKPSKYMNMATLKESHHLEENNWANWSRCMIPILKVCKVWGYINGTIDCLNERINQKSASNWDVNDELAKLIILQNVKATQLPCPGSNSHWPKSGSN